MFIFDDSCLVILPNIDYIILLLSINTQILTEKDRRTDGNRPVFEDSSFLDRHSRLKPQTAYGILGVTYNARFIPYIQNITTESLLRSTTGSN